MLAGVSGPDGGREDLDISAQTSSRQVEIRWGALGFAPARVNAVSKFLWERRIEPGAREPAGRPLEVGERERVSVGILVVVMLYSMEDWVVGWYRIPVAGKPVICMYGRMYRVEWF